MPRCAVVADVDPCLSAVTAHLLTSVFDTPVYRSQIHRQIDFYTSVAPNFDSALAAEIVGSPIGDYRLPDELAHEDVVALISVTGIAPHDKSAVRLLNHDVPVLQLGKFHPMKIDFANFDERVAGHSFALALAEASVGMCDYLLNFLVPFTKEDRKHLPLKPH
jgi:hypothetical protein